MEALRVAKILFPSEAVPRQRFPGYAGVSGGVKAHIDGGGR